MIEIRKKHPVFGTGIYEELTSSNPSVLAFCRLPSAEDPETDGSDRILCVNNLSRFPQPVELDLRRFEGWTPIELTGRVEFPPIGVLPYMLTLAGHGFYWFELSRPVEEAVPEEEPGTASTSAVAEALLASGVVHPEEETTETGPPTPPSDRPGGAR
jgi:maltose alpha-D-glucosyltransferase/alpha-amylase